MSAADILRKAADHVLTADCDQCKHSHRDHVIGQPYYGCVNRSCDCTSWLPVVSTQVAGPLAAWLRAEAALAVSLDHRPDPLATMLDIDQADLHMYADGNPPALALARAILGEVS